MEEDWLVKKIKLVGEGIGLCLKKQMTSNDLNEVEREDRTKID